MERYAVFTKPWKDCNVEKLAEIVKSMGFNAIEFPLRDGYQATPAKADVELPKLVKTLGEMGVTVADVASSLTERVFEGCAKAGVPMIRVMFSADPGNFLEKEKAYVDDLSKSAELAAQYGVQIGVQMHCGGGADTSAGLYRVVSPFPVEQVGAIWDAAHSGIADEQPEQAIDMLWDHLCLVNFKNARMVMKSRGADGEAEFDQYFCPGPDGQCSWPRAVKHLKAKGYKGVWCMPAEYTDGANGRDIEYARKDLIWLKSLVEG